VACSGTALAFLTLHEVHIANAECEARLCLPTGFMHASPLKLTGFNNFVHLIPFILLYFTFSGLERLSTFYDAFFGFLNLIYTLGKTPLDEG
jgi:hypothetical protein